MKKPNQPRPPRAKCPQCGLKVPLYFDRMPNAHKATIRLTYHDNKEGTACPAGGAVIHHDPTPKQRRS